MFLTTFVKWHQGSIIMVAMLTVPLESSYKGFHCEEHAS